MPKPPNARKSKVAQSPTMPMRRMSDPPTLYRKSSMRVRTIDESLDSQYGSSGERRKKADSLEDASVVFHEIRTREYSRAVGDNPSCSSGAPISLGWEYNPEHQVVGVEEYEESRSYRRTTREMAMPRPVRHEILIEEWGATKPQIAKAIRENIRIKNSRRRTVNNLGKMTKVEELFQSAKRKVKRTLQGQKKPSVQCEIWLEEVRRAEEAIAAENAAWEAQHQVDQDGPISKLESTIPSKLTLDSERREQDMHSELTVKADTHNSLSPDPSMGKGSAYLPNPLDKHHKRPNITCQEPDECETLAPHTARPAAA